MKKPSHERGLEVIGRWLDAVNFLLNLDAQRFVALTLGHEKLGLKLAQFGVAFTQVVMVVRAVVDWIHEILLSWPEKWELLRIAPLLI